MKIKDESHTRDKLQKTLNNQTYSSRPSLGGRPEQVHNVSGWIQYAIESKSSDEHR
jgi:hypothetical protein